MSRDIPAPAPDRSPASDLISALRERAPRLALALAAGQMALPAGRYVHGKIRERATYTVKVSGMDDMYDDLHEWVLDLLPSREQRALVAWTARQRMLEMPLDRPAKKAPALMRLRYDGTREHVIMVAGHRIRVAVTDSEPTTGEGQRWKPPEITFTARSLPAREAFLREIENVLRRSHETKRQPAFRMLDKWGDWERLDDLPPRDLDSVILPAGQLERLVADAGRFLASEQEYVRRCIPWHRGHLYEGPPGTGKTSVARAIASRFGMDTWYMPLADVKRDGELLQMVNRISPRSMLLLEDIDVFHAATERDDTPDGITLSGLLNALDGIATPHGLLTVMTTNTPEVLDHAVVRAGRADLVEHFAYTSGGQADRLITRWYGQPVPGAGKITGIAPGDVIEACKRHDDPVAAVGELEALASASRAGR